MLENNGIDIIHDENSHFKNKVKVKGINKCIFILFSKKTSCCFKWKEKARNKCKKTERGNWVGRSNERDIFFFTFVQMGQTKENRFWVKLYDK